MLFPLEFGSWQPGISSFQFVKLLQLFNSNSRYLGRKSGRGMVSPFVEVEMCGADYDNLKQKTKTINDNGFNPVWDETFLFTVKNPSLALLR
jgi:hypothetical protein